MRLSKFTDYNLRALIYLAINENKLSNVSEISEKFEISYNHMVKVIHHLSKLEIIHTTKGKGGGIRLMINPSDINIGKLIRELEGDSDLLECFTKEGNCKLNPACKLKSALFHAQNEFYKSLEVYTLEDILTNKLTLKKSLDL